MALFNIKIHSGVSIFDQVVYAAQKAFLSREFLPGQPFPSGRALAAELKIHPNTAHKVIQHLIRERWLVAQPGVGTVVAEPPIARPGDKKKLLQQDVERLVVEAKRVGASIQDVVQAISTQWNQFESVAEERRK